MDEIDYSALSVKSPEDFVRFMDDLLENYLDDYPGEWKNKGLLEYLKGIRATVQPTIDWLVIAKETDSYSATWKTFAFILLHAATARPVEEPESNNS